MRKRAKILSGVKLLAMALLLLLGVGCTSGKSSEESVEMLADGEVEHTLVMYLIANNNLEASLYRNLLDAEEGMKGALPSTRLVVYLDNRNETTLYEIRYRTYGSGEHVRYCRELKKYPEQVSTTPEVMRGVLEDVKRLAPSKSYGLVLSGHGTGWFPKPSSGTSYDKQKVAPMGQWGGVEHTFNFERYVPETRAMGYDLVMQPDGSYERTDESFISASEIVEGLAPIHFDYIIFDACFMSSVEFLYDLRNSADYVVASPVEILGVGLPYVEIVRTLMSVQYDVRNVPEIVLNVYLRDNYFTATKSLALAVIDCSELEALAEAVADVYASVRVGDYKATIRERVDMERVQVLDRMHPAAFYDLEDYVCELAGEGALKEKFLTALGRAVAVVHHTEDIYSLGYSDDGFSMGYDNIENKVDGVLELCGINTYIPCYNYPTTLSHYFQTSWAKKIYAVE